MSTLNVRSGSIKIETKSGLVPVLDDAAWLTKHLAKKAPPAPVVALPKPAEINPPVVVQASVFLLPEESDPAGHYAPWYWDDLEAMTGRRKADAIVNRIADECGVPLEEIFGHSRIQYYVRVRHRAVIAVAHAQPQWSLAQVGRYFGRDHTSIIHALKKAGFPSRPRKTMMHVAWDLAERGHSLPNIAIALGCYPSEARRALEAGRRAHERSKP